MRKNLENYIFGLGYDEPRTFEQMVDRVNSSELDNVIKNYNKYHSDYHTKKIFLSAQENDIIIKKSKRLLSFMGEFMLNQGGFTMAELKLPHNTILNNETPWSLPMSELKEDYAYIPCWLTNINPIICVEIIHRKGRGAVVYLQRHPIDGKWLVKIETIKSNGWSINPSPRVSLLANSGFYVFDLMPMEKKFLNWINENPLEVKE